MMSGLLDIIARSTDKIALGRNRMSQSIRLIQRLRPIVQMGTMVGKSNMKMMSNSSKRMIHSGIQLKLNATFKINEDSKLTDGTYVKELGEKERLQFLKDLDNWNENKLNESISLSNESIENKKKENEKDVNIEVSELDMLNRRNTYFVDSEALNIFIEGLDVFKLGDYEKAMELFTTASQRDNCAIGIYSIGICYLKLKEFEHSIKFLEKSLEYDPFFEPSLLNLATINREYLNDKEKGDRYFQILEASRILLKMNSDELNKILKEASEKRTENDS